MEKLESHIASLRAEIADQYARGEHDAALETSRRLDKLIAMRQREALELKNKQ